MGCGTARPEEERVADCQAPSTPLFPREREGEFCSFLRHSVRTLAEGVAGPARICNVGAGFWDTRVAPRGRGGQGDGAGSLSRVFAAAHPCQTAHGRFTNRPYRGAGGGARGSVPRVGEGSTAVRIFQEGWRKCGIGADWWGEMAQSWGLVGRERGWMGQGRERVAREGDAFFGVRGRD